MFLTMRYWLTAQAVVALALALSAGPAQAQSARRQSRLVALQQQNALQQQQNAVQTAVQQTTILLQGAYQQNGVPRTVAGPNLINFQQSLVNNENGLLTSWYQFQVQRLQLYRDLGTLPFDEWEAFYELFPELSSDAYAPAATRDEGTTRASTTSAEPEAGVVPR